MTKWKIYNEDAVEWARNYQKAKFHALLCDAPYHLTSIVKRFGKKNSAPAKFGTDGVFSRASKGFMGTQWDGGDLAFRPETWEAFGEVLHPGAFGMAFSASRNWHRMAIAIEGFLSVHPSEMIRHADLLAHARDEKDWNLVELVEKWMREQASIQEALSQAGFILHPTIFLWAQGQGFPKATRVKGQENFDGHRYGLQALKPAVEPIIVFQKPYEDRPLDNIVETGAGALNIDGARIPTQGENVIINRFTDGAKPWGNGAGHEYDTESTQQGRWPANLILTEESAKNLDAQTGVLTSGKPGIRRKKLDSNIYGGGNGLGFDVSGDVEVGVGDAGGASRFFYNVSTKLDESDPVYYCGKVSPKERNAGLDDSFEDVKGSPDYRPNDDGTHDIQSRLHGATVKGRNPHPTLKPIDLMRYLATLLLPPIEYAPRRIFIPFSGVASEMIGAGLAGWEHIVGVENDTENGYVDIAEKRLQHWLGTR